MYINQAPYLQQLVPDFIEMMKENGWENFLSYRAKNGSKYAAVRLFRSYGSDRQTRHLGLAWSYDVENTHYKDMRIIPESSPLGLIGVAKGGEETFSIPVYPVVIEEFHLFEDGRRINPNLYVVNNDKGTVTYTAEAGSVLTANYKLSEKADDPPTHLTFFLFDNVQMAGGDGRVSKRFDETNEVEYILEDTPINTSTLKVELFERKPVGGGFNTVKEELILNEDFTINSITGILTLKEPLEETENERWLIVSYNKALVVKSTIEFTDGEKEVYLPITDISDELFVVELDGKETIDYDMDFETGKLTINESYGVARVTFLDNTGSSPIGESEIIGDVDVSGGITVNNTRSLMDAVYSSLMYSSPSLPTVLNFSSEREIALSWQRDSQVEVTGQLNRDRGLFQFRADPTGDASTTLFSPLYFGRLNAHGRVPRVNTILASGANNHHELKYSRNLELGGNNVDYGPGTGNGNSGLMLGQAIGGARYQTHYLRFFTFSKDADPTGEGRFNKSRWTGRYHVSLIGIVHPNDGVVGYLDDALVVHPKGIYQNNELETGIEERLEKIGKGDGRRSVFYPTYHPTGNIKLMVGCEEVTDFDYDEETKAITLKEPAPNGDDVRVQYTYSSLFHYFLPTAPRCAWTLKEYSPYIPMGIAFLKDKNHTPLADN